MAYWLDYSAVKLSGAVIKAAGYTGVIRYIDSPPNLRTKHTSKTEYDSHRAAGLGVRLVMQTTTTASDGGYPVGQDHARRALAGAQHLGYSGVIYFTNDRTTLPSTTTWDDYLTGAASILGWGRAGAYGFANAMDVASHMTGCKHFWQSGRRSDVRPFVQFWQDNNTQVTVGGVLCDRNLILKPLEEDDMTPEELLNYPIPRVGSALGGNTSLRAVLANFDRSLELEAARDKALGVAVSALAQNPDLDAEAVTAIFRSVVQDNTPTADQIAAAQLPHIQAAVRAVLGVDNAEQADAIVDELVSRLVNPIPEGN